MFRLHRVARRSFQVTISGHSLDTLPVRWRPGDSGCVHTWTALLRHGQISRQTVKRPFRNFFTSPNNDARRPSQATKPQSTQESPIQRPAPDASPRPPRPPPRQPSSRHPFFSHLWTLSRYPRYFLSGFFILHLFITYFYAISLTWGISMLPTLDADGQVVVISKLYRRGRYLRVGDLISFRHPLDPEIMAIKRVVGLEGDFVLRDSPVDEDEVERLMDYAASTSNANASTTFADGTGGRADNESVEPESGGGTETEKETRIPLMVQIPRGHCYVVGDNFRHSRDSRMFGPLPINLVQGKVVAKIVMGSAGIPFLPWFQGMDSQMNDSVSVDMDVD